LKGLALEYVIKFMILVVATIVVISFIVSYSEQIREFFVRLKNTNKDYGQKVINCDSSCTTSQLKTFIIACWEKYKKMGYKNEICYALLGDVSKVDENVLKNSLEQPNLVDISKFDKSKKTTVIKALSNGIIVESV
jgi:hypothetical protein